MLIEHANNTYLAIAYLVILKGEWQIKELPVIFTRLTERHKCPLLIS
ncbi:MAG: hypothetical protein ABI472_12905 [Ginsengibacter sp.]